MKDYALIKTDYEYRFILFATTYVNPLPYLLDIKEKLNLDNFKGNILVDQLLSNGFSKNRFFEIYFDGNEFDFKTIKNVEVISNDISCVLSEFYTQNDSLVKKSNILVDAQKYIILNKLLVK